MGTTLSGHHVNCRWGLCLSDYSILCFDPVACHCVRKMCCYVCVNTYHCVSGRVHVCERAHIPVEKTLCLSFLQMPRCQTHPPFTLSVNCVPCAPVEVQQEVSTDWLFSTRTHLQWCENSFNTYKYFGMQVCLRDSLWLLPCDYGRIEAITLEVLCPFKILLHTDLKKLQPTFQV